MPISNTMTPHELVDAATKVTTLAEAGAIDQALVALIGGEYRRPLGDSWNNFGMVSYSGDFDHKVIEAVTNAQDAIIEREAAKRFGRGDVPYTSPREAAVALLDLDAQATRDRIFVELEAGGDPKDQKRITISVTDDGCGMTPRQMTSTILQLGSASKTGSLYQQGAFGLGVKSTFRNAHAAVIISRRAPEMQDGEDRVTVAVVTWADYDLKGLGASYLTTTDWDAGTNPAAEPWSVQADEVDFPVGTKVILVEYQVKGFHRAYSADNRAFAMVADTRLHEPVIPFRFISQLVKKPEPRPVRGLRRALEDNTPELHGLERLPFQIEGVTYQLPIRWWVFSARAQDSGGRDKRVAAGHVVSFTSSGQVHHHWDKARFKAETGFNKVDDRVYVVVETDELPIRMRTRLFTPDRASLLPSESAIRLEAQVAATLRDLDELREVNGQLQREAIESAIGSRKTRAVARRISEAFLAKGFASSAAGGSGLKSKTPKPGKPKSLKLLNEPTELTGPKTITVRPDSTRAITFWLDAKDAFMEKGIGTFDITCDHPDLGPGELLPSDLLNGRIRVNALIPEDAKLGEYTITARIPEWTSAAGGLAGPLEHELTLLVTDEPPMPREAEKPSGASGAGGEVALQWRDKDIAANNAGFVEQVAAVNLAEDPEYADLRKLGETPIPTIVLNENFSELRKYLNAVRGRSNKSDRAVEDARGRYAAGVGVGLLVAHNDDALRDLSDDARAAIGRAQARTALSLLPDFDKLMAQYDTD